MTPKSLLRHRECESSVEDFETGRFQPVVTDTERKNGTSSENILLCSGKIYYELLERRRELEGATPALIRLEQFYPLPVEELRDAFSKYAMGRKVTWVQEEPANMGAWQFLRVHWDQYFSSIPLSCISRPASASPATGSKTAHEREQKLLIERAFGRD
jgi:2-oxoglutarate dehydrogenase E1 component